MSDPLLDARTIFQLYLPLITTKLSLRLFLTWDKRNKYYKNSPIGINQLRKLPSKVAEYNKLPDPKIYTGHSFRVSGATALADAGITVTNLKRHGGWKSDSVVEGYLRESKKAKSDVATMIAGDNASVSTTQQQLDLGSIVFSGCTIHGNVYVYNK